ncbi:efflux RND transporter permease subunit [Marinobacterium sediminicola]|uniref:Multidrug efflux pump subunit AcrB n=1 Tax=Marinobacterium sediminicola TaxID=518898 RepID=A0ABY1S339_9GAMM|nr:efflux RND transporter permease subunit [Marinobacterium sediminicola]ULG68153.1 efflux RND transporter permease subunit [Marinobacterium sediminicola]SMR77678.1 Multidrug efflux pump subunit AcrB [Marinobacterium sediminicola]
MDIARYSIAKRTSLWVVVLLVLLGGYISYGKLARFEDPEFIIRQAVIVASYPGASAQEVADEVTDRLEAAVQALQELEQVKSVSKQGYSEVSVEIKMEFARTHAELQQVWDKLRRKVVDVERTLPPGVGPVIVNDDFADVYALFYAITGEGYSDRELQTYADWLSRELALVPGVARTALLADRDERIFIEISRERLAGFGLEAQQIYQVLQKQNMVTVAGEMEADGMRVPVVPVRAVSDFSDLQTLQVGLGPDNTVLRLSDIADVVRGYQEPVALKMTYDGQRAVGLGISNVLGGNVVAMGDAVKQHLAELEGQRPIGMELHPISLQSDAVRASVSAFVSNLAAAVGIVFVVLLVFMGLRIGLIIGFVLLLTVAGTLIIMLFDNIAMQRISLGALIIALGMLVDNAIVVSDGVLVRLQQGEVREAAISAVVKNTIWPLLGGTLVGILAFSAIGLSPSDMGEYAGTLFWVILFSMLLSWVFAITVTPLLCYQFLNVQPQSEPQPPGRMTRGYAAILRWVLSHRLVAVVMLLGTLAAAVLSARLVPPGFMPDSERPQFVVDLYLPQGTDIETTAERMARVEQVVAAKDGVTHVTGFVGGGGLRFMLTYAPEPRNSSYAQLLVDVDDYRRIAPLVAELQQELSEQLPDTSVKVWKFMLGRGGGKKIEVAFSGPDARVLRRLAEEAKALMEQQPSLIAIQDDWRDQVPVAQPVWLQEPLQRLGLTESEVNAALAQTLNGRQVGVYREGDELIPLVVRAPESERERLRAIENSSVFSPSAGVTVAMNQLLSSVSLVWQDALIRRIDRQPTIMVQADPAPGVVTNTAFAHIRPKIEAMALPPGYRLKWYGEYESSREANAGLAASAPYGFAAMILAVVFMFNALRQPLVIWMTAPLALIGVVVGLILFQTPFEFMAILGFLSLIGMMVKNAIVLVDEADQYILEGQVPYNAVVNACLSRARPVVLGALTTILGVVPLLVDPFFKSMAVTVMFGLLFATALTLVVLPLFYALVFRIPAKPGADKSLT